MKENILKAIQNLDSKLCLVIARNYLGKGVDCAKFYAVIVYGPPKNFRKLEELEEMARLRRHYYYTLPFICEKWIVM